MLKQLATLKIAINISKDLQKLIDSFIQPKPSRVEKSLAARRTTKPKSKPHRNKTTHYDSTKFTAAERNRVRVTFTEHFNNKKKDITYKRTQAELVAYLNTQFNKNKSLTSYRNIYLSQLKK